ncbi:MAG: hypothetical protein KF692_09595 [Cryobacterium sp.]|nr:hypothetical protein [Cryobacterium sp.]
MSNKPTLLFLHGVGDGDKDDNWKIPFTEALAQLGYPDLENVRVVAPKYSHALKGWDYKVPLPDVTGKPLSREQAKKNRRDFERRMGAIEFRLGRHNGGNIPPGVDSAIDAAVGAAAKLSKFRQAQNYIKSPQIRAQVLDHIISKLPPSGQLVIVAHSLGSVIAADLIRRLPVGLKVAGMVTIGSPLAIGFFDVEKLRDSLKEPPTNLDWWVNFWNASDPVAAHRGVSFVIPWMLDFRIDTKKVDVHAHDANEYLSNRAVASAIGFALFGSRSKELVKASKGLDIPLDDTERLALLPLRYASLILMRLEGDLKDRYAGALRQVQATLVDNIRQRNDREQRPIPSEIARLDFDLSDPDAIVPAPLPSSHMPKEDAVALLTIIAAENIIRPFEIEIAKDKQQAAMEDLTAEMGLGSRFGTAVFDSARTAQRALGADREVNWLKWGALGAGAAVLVLATGGLALAAAPGVAGAAVITSALASFGPGGMIGGLLTAGTLATAGGGGIAYSLANPGTTAETVEAFVQNRLAAAVLRASQDLDQDPATWRILAETEIGIRREHERLDEFSDKSGPALNELKRKITTIERALKYLSENGLEPGIPANRSYNED